MGEAGFVRTGVICRMSAGIGHVKVNRFIIKDVYALNKISIHKVMPLSTIISLSVIIPCI